MPKNDLSVMILYIAKTRRHIRVTVECWLLETTPSHDPHQNKYISPSQSGGSKDFKFVSSIGKLSLKFIESEGRVYTTIIIKLSSVCEVTLTP